jgi:hypothetical protein
MMNIISQPCYPSSESLLLRPEVAGAHEDVKKVAGDSSMPSAGGAYANLTLPWSTEGNSAQNTNKLTISATHLCTGYAQVHNSMRTVSSVQGFRQSYPRTPSAPEFPFTSTAFLAASRQTSNLQSGFPSLMGYGLSSAFPLTSSPLATPCHTGSSLFSIDPAYPTPMSPYLADADGTGQNALSVDTTISGKCSVFVIT